LSDVAFTTAGADQGAKVARTLARAFHGDPVFRWMIPDERARSERLPDLFAALFRIDLSLGRILSGAGGHAASFWRPPGAAETPFTQMLRHGPTLLHVFRSGIGRSLAVSNGIAAHLPRHRPYWYAHFVGVDPDVQGQGLGAAMMRTGIAHAAKDGLPVYLETARIENVNFYRGIGFSVTTEWDVPSGPHFWSMMLEP
jgi:ribosomal protein S18 acetylase RimI-like enzyme